MKTTVIAFVVAFTSLNAMAAELIVNCKATREGPRSDGRPGYEKIDEKTIVTGVTPRLTVTELIGATVKTYFNATGDYVLVLIDKDLETSSTSMGTLDNKHIDLSLSGKGLSNYLNCKVL